MAQAELNNGQSLLAVNDLFIGPKSHVSARYTIEFDGRTETHSSSGVIVSTGVGSTGWFRSLLTGAAGVFGGAREMQLYAKGSHGSLTRGQFNATAFPWDADHLYFTVREPFPTQTTGVELVFGRVTPEAPLTLISQMAENGVIFSDGIEQDYLEFNHGTQAVIGLAERKGVLVE